MICVSSSYLGTTRHLLVDPALAVTWVPNCPDGAWTWGFDVGSRRLEEPARIFRMEVSDLVPEPHRKSMVTVLADPGCPIPWHHVLSSAEHSARMKHFLEDLRDLVGALDDSGYGTTYILSRRFIDDLSRAPINIRQLQHHVEREANPTSLSTLKSFLPNSAGFASVCKYSLSDTSTGRMIVKSGPRILTLPTKYKDVFSSGRDRSLIQLDFVSLEPRVALCISTGESFYGDAYEHVNQALFAGQLSRPQVKIATLCALYGVSATKLRDTMGDIGDARKIIQEVREFFAVQAQVKIMKTRLKEDGFLQNFFGRPLFFENSSDHVLFSHFIQSTAVDVAMSGFSGLKHEMKAREMYMNPLFIIHDALVLEVDSNSLDELRQLCCEGIDIAGLGKFPLSLQVLSVGDK